uniref:Reverse transcriptase zinc-binding domain-containing protein n=1 Tax=Lactuca sativa TaxID=4236 RepID=A0A9R1XRA0_LACSA|nr:hypothetical protein LSAT_V11C100040180 [Lactuca sativa]
MVGNLLQSVHISAKRDYWHWFFGSEDMFLVKETRLQLDQAILPSVGLVTRWNRWLPIKVNIFIWRVVLNRNPTGDNLDRRGSDIASVLCLVALHIPSFSSIEEQPQWVDGLTTVRSKRSNVDSFHNDTVFGNKKMKKQILYDSIVSFSFNWYCARKCKASIIWTEWLKNPIMN